MTEVDKFVQEITEIIKNSSVQRVTEDGNVGLVITLQIQVPITDSDGNNFILPSFSQASRVVNECRDKFPGVIIVYQTKKP